VHHRLPHLLPEWTEEQDLGGSPVVAHAQQTRAKYSCRVEDDDVAGGDELLEVAELPVRDLAGHAVDHHQPALATSLGGELSDAIDRQLEIVVRGAGAVARHR